MLTVHCLPLCSGEENKKDNKVANIVRIAENKIMYGGWLGKKIRKNTIPHKTWQGSDKCNLVLTSASDQTKDNVDD